MRKLMRALCLEHLLPAVSKQHSTAFTVALICLSGKLAKSDGVATESESEAFERLHAIVPEERDNVRRMFDLAARDVTGFDDYARDMAQLLGEDQDLKRDVLTGLFHIAVADGLLHPEEERHLQRAAEIFGLGSSEFRALRGLFIHDPDDPYTILALSPDATDAAVRAQYKLLVREHHPDQMIGRGVPQEYIRFATAKLAEINSAYDKIAKERGL